MGTKMKCNNCGDILESKHVHDYKTCKCRYKSQKRIHICETALLAILPELTDKEKHLLGGTLHDHYLEGITVDGGDEYLRYSYAKNTTFTFIEED